MLPRFLDAVVPWGRRPGQLALLLVFVTVAHMRRQCCHTVMRWKAKSKATVAS